MKRYYTLTELATRFGYTRPAAQGWQQHPDFPEPDALTGVVQGWELDTFRAWALAHRPDILFNETTNHAEQDENATSRGGVTHERTKP